MVRLASFLQPLRPLPRRPRLEPLFLLETTTADADVAQGRQVAGLSMAKQLEDNWCWAAITQAVLKQRLSTSRTQEAIAWRHMERTGKPVCPAPHKRHQNGGTCREGNCTGLCNDEHYLRFALAEWNCYRETLNRPDQYPSFDQVKAEIGANRPVACRIDRGGPGHFVLISGWSIAGGSERVMVLDPAHGVDGGQVPSHEMPFRDFLRFYPFGGGTGSVSHAYGVN